jgi:hypothetical protein
VSKNSLTGKTSLVIVFLSLSLVILGLSNLHQVFGNGLPPNGTDTTSSPQQPNFQSFAPAQQQPQPQQQQQPQQQVVPPLNQSSPQITPSQPQQQLTTPNSQPNQNINSPQITAQQPAQPAASSITIVPQQGPPATFDAKGTINSLIFVPQTKWIATGNWSMDVDNGNLTAFYTNMSWFDEKGTATHTHEFQNFRPNPEFKIVSLGPNNTIALAGLMDVGTNKKVVWKDVPTTISIKGGKTIAISVADDATNKHFAAQPILGVANSLTSGLDVSVIPAEDSISPGDQQSINITVSDSSSDKKIEGASLTGVVIDAFPGADEILGDRMNSTEPIATTDIDGQKFSGDTDSNGQFSTTQRISDSKRPGTFTIVVTVNAEGYDPISKIVTFNVGDDSD